MNIATRALLLRRVEYRESDLVVTLFTEALGKVSAIARAARRSRTRFGGSLEAMHTLHVELDDLRRGELMTLNSSRIDQARLHLTQSLSQLNNAGHALGWVRDAAAERVAEPELFAALNRALDAWDEPTNQTESKRVLASFGLRLLALVGWGLDFDQCVGCGTPCPEGKSARVDANRGGILCSRCGVGVTLLTAAQRLRMGSAGRGDAQSLVPEDTDAALSLVDQTLLSHANVGRKQ